MQKWYDIFEKDFPEISKSCLEMEYDLSHHQPEGVILWGGVTIENIINIICQNEKICLNEGCKTDLNIKIDELYDKKIITETLYTHLHQVRILRNDVAHNRYTANMDEAYGVHHKVYNFAVWFYKNYGNDPNFRMSSYESVFYNDDETIRRKLNETFKNNSNKPKFTCPNCGSEINANFNYCLECGAKLNLTNNNKKDTGLRNLPTDLIQYGLDMAKRKLIIKSQESKMNYRERSNKLQNEKIFTENKIRTLVNNQKEREETRLQAQIAKRNKTLYQLKIKHENEQKQLNDDYNYVNSQITKLVNDLNNTPEDTKLIEDLKYYKNEKNLIKNRIDSLNIKQKDEYQSTVEQLNFEYETILQINYQDKKDTLNIVHRKKDLLSKRVEELNREHEEKIINNLVKIPCHYCGQMNPNDSVYCEKCGKLINKDKLPDDPDLIKIRCSHCKYMNTYDAEFCINCGKLINE